MRARAAHADTRLRLERVEMPLFSTPKRARAADDAVSVPGQEDLRALVGCWRYLLSLAFALPYLPCPRVRMH